MSAFELEGLAYLSFFDDGSWFQVKFCFIPVTFAIAKQLWLLQEQLEVGMSVAYVEPGIQVYIRACLHGGQGAFSLGYAEDLRRGFQSFAAYRRAIDEMSAY